MGKSGKSPNSSPASADQISFELFPPPRNLVVRNKSRMSEQLDRIYERLLILRCQTGDEQAFAELVERYDARLRVFVRKMLNSDAHAAADVVQDVWFDVFRSIDRLADVGAFRGWLYRIARDRTYRLLRRRGVQIAPMDDAGAILATEADTAIDADDIRLVHTSLERLPHEQREVLLLRFVEELSYEQIALAVGCELGTVRSRLHYAKRALREIIERNGHE